MAVVFTSEQIDANSIEVCLPGFTNFGVIICLTVLFFLEGFFLVNPSYWKLEISASHINTFAANAVTESQKLQNGFRCLSSLATKKNRLRHST